MGLIFDAFFAGRYPASVPAPISISVAEKQEFYLLMDLL